MTKLITKALEELDAVQLEELLSLAKTRANQEGATRSKGFDATVICTCLLRNGACSSWGSSMRIAPYALAVVGMVLLMWRGAGVGVRLLQGRGTLRSIFITDEDGERVGQC